MLHKESSLLFEFRKLNFQRITQNIKLNYLKILQLGEKIDEISILSRFLFILFALNWEICIIYFFTEN